MTDAIQTKMQKLGSGLVGEAEKQHNEALQARIIDEVRDIIRKIDECERTMKIARLGLSHFKAQKEALESGEFSIHPIRNSIVYKDDNLNRNYMDL